MEGRNLLLTNANQEAGNWKKILGLLQQENILQKNKLAEILKHNNHEKNGPILEKAEQFQNQFLQQDEVLRFMWDDLAELEKLINHRSLKNGDAILQINDQRKKLEKEVAALRIHFDQLKSHFFSFLKLFRELD